MSKILSNDQLEVIFATKDNMTLEQAEQIIETLKSEDKALYPKCKELGLSEKTAKRIGSEIKAHGYVFSQKLKQFILATEKAEKELEHDKSKQKKSPATKPKTNPKNDVKVDTDILARIEQLELQVKSLNAIKEELKSNHRAIKEESKTTLDSLVVRPLEGEWKNKNYCIYPETEQKLNEIYSKYPQYKRTDIINTLLLEGIDKYL